MGRFLSIVAVLAACGDNLDTGSPVGEYDQVRPINSDELSQRLLPEVCGVQSWTTTVADYAVDLSIVARPQGATVLAVPEAGGTMTGFTLDTRMNMIGDATKINIATNFGQVSASLVGDRVVASSVQDGSVYIHMLDDALANPQWIAKLPGSFIGEPTFVHTQADLVMPAAGENGLTLYRLDDSLEPLEEKLVLATKPATGITTTQMGVAAMTAWSTESDCYMMVNYAYIAGPYASAPRPCIDPRLAMNEATGEGAMVFESAEGIRLMRTVSTQMGGDAPVLRANGSSPRIVFDGTRFWVSYISERGDVIVGFVDDNNKLVSTSLNDPKPTRHGYELAIVMGSPWVFATDVDGYTAHRMCAVSP